MRKFLASVGNAKLLGKVNGKVEHIADVRTLTESTLSFSNTQEEVRAGEGAQLYGRFSHDSGLTVNLTDAMFDINYVALQVGAAIGSGAATGLYKDDQFSSTDTASGTVTLTKNPQDIGIACGLDRCFVWAREKGCKADEAWIAIPATKNSKSLTLPNSLKGKNICTEYFVEKPGNSAIQVNANFIPAELILILTTKLFAGDASAPETGKPIGEITVKIPRFSLDGTFDLSMAMSSAATISLAGTALAVSDGGCDGKGVYAEIVEIVDGISLMSNLEDIVIDPETVEDGGIPTVYGKFANGSISQIDNEYVKIYNGTAFKASADSSLDSGVNTVVVYDPNVNSTLPTSGTITLNAQTNYGTSDAPAYYLAEAATVS